MEFPERRLKAVLRTKRREVANLGHIPRITGFQAASFSLTTLARAPYSRHRSESACLGILSKGSLYE
jgi:hypothetical protein